MRLGTMNDPRLNASQELRWAAEHGFDFLDLTIEGPNADLEKLKVAELQAICEETGIAIVGHTAPYLPFSSPIARVRQAAVESVVDTFEIFVALRAQWVNVHLIPAPALFSNKQWMRWAIESFVALAERAEPYGLRIMVEHPPRSNIGAMEMGKVMEADERLGFHLDVGHANVGGDRLEGLLKTVGSRLVHVHLSDNKGRNDDHLALGDGFVNWSRAMRLIKRTGFDDTFTLEVQSPDRDYLLLSAQKVRQWWAEVPELEEETESAETSEPEDAPGA